MRHSTDEHGNTALILGATGGFGAAACDAMVKAGWQVRAVSRSPKEQSGQTHVELNRPAIGESENHAGGSAQNALQWFTGTLDNPETLARAATGVDVIVHAVNVPYPKWDPVMVQYTQHIIDLALEHNAHLFFVGNIYNAGIPSDGLIDHNTQHAPINNKGDVRETLERMIEGACSEGLRATVMRFGDFFGPGVATNNWFNEFTKSLHKNRLTIPGPVDVQHTWAFLPDAALVAERVVRKRIHDNDAPAHMVLPFAGHVFSFADVKRELKSMTGHTLKTSSLPWPLFTALGLFIPLLRDVVKMRYLWQHDIRLNESALVSYLGTVPAKTPLRDAICRTIPALQRNTEKTDTLPDNNTRPEKTLSY